MYIKHKFVNLEELCVSKQISRLWEPLSTLVIDVITGYVFDIPKFRLDIGSRISLDVIKQCFDIYIRRTNAKNLTIIFTLACQQGITFEKRHAASTPYMKINVDKERFREIGPIAAVEEFKNIARYIGPHLHVLNLNGVFGANYDSKLSAFDADLMNIVLTTCPVLQELTIDINDNQLKCCEKREEPHTELRTIRFGSKTQFEDQFFEVISTSVPNLNSLTLGCIVDQIPYYHINTPSTDLKELMVILKYDFSQGSDSLIVTTFNTREDNKTGYYQCCVSDDKVELWNEDKSQQPEKDPLFTLEITCSTIKTFTLTTGLEGCILHS